MKISSAKRWFTLFAVVVICATVGYGQRRRGRAAQPSPQARLTEMKLLPYNGMSDTFGDNLAPDHALFNDLDISVLVKVEVTGRAGEYSDRNVEITARQGNKVILNRTAMVGIYNEGGKYYVTAWIYGPLCQETVVQARLLGQRQPSVIRKTIGANCGE